MSVKNILLEAASELTHMTNERDPDCDMCNGTTEFDGSGHMKDCLINRLKDYAESLEGES